MNGIRQPGPGPPYWVLEEILETRAERTRKIAEVVARKRAGLCEAQRIGKVLADMVEEQRKERNRAVKKNEPKKDKGYKGSKELIADVEKNLNLGKEGEDGFAPVYDPASGEVWKFENEGDRVEGIYFSSFAHAGDFGESRCYKLWSPSEDKVYLCWSTFVLQKYMDACPLGSYVRIEYKGKAGRAHNFAILFNKNLTTKYADKAKSLIEEAQRKEKEQGEFPAM